MTPENVYMDSMPLRWGHIRVLVIASMGQLVGAGVSTLVGIVIPMLQLILHPELTSFQQGAIAGTALVGIMVGSVLIGRWSDRYGYLKFFRSCPALIFAASLLAYFSDSLPWLIVSLFLMGFGVGGGYSLDSDYISEIMPKRWKLVMVGIAKASSSLGNIVIALVCFFILSAWRDPQMWNKLLLLISILSLIMFMTRIRFANSPGWLLVHGRADEAQRVVRYFLGQDVVIGDIKHRPKREDLPDTNWLDLFRSDNIKRVIFSGIPWACEGLGVYGIGVFMPILVMSLNLFPQSQRPFDHIISSVELTMYISFFILFGFIAGLLVVNRWRHVRIQFWGFVLCSVGLAVMLLAYKFHLPVWVTIFGFMFFEFFLNAGPHLMTFIIPPQIYPVAERSSGSGLAASMGKFGAVIGALCVPLLLRWGGVELVLLVSIIVQLVGAVITIVFGRMVVVTKHLQGNLKESKVPSVIKQ